MANTVK